MNGIELIAAERQRQIDDEHWTAEHDDTHDKGQMARAAACYCSPVLAGHESNWPRDWGWDWWKPTPGDRIRELAKAGALVAAEIDRIQRLGDVTAANRGATVIVTPSLLMDKGHWDDYCAWSGTSEWAVSEGQMDGDEAIEIPLSKAKEFGIA